MTVRAWTGQLAAPRFWRDERAVAAMEAAFMAPFLLLLFFGIVELGNLFFSQHAMQTGVRDAARFLARVDNTTANEALARQLATTGSALAGTPARLDWWSASDVAISYRAIDNTPDALTGARDYRGGDTITVVDVSTTVTYQGLGFLSAMGLDAIPIHVAHEERVIGE